VRPDGRDYLELPEGRRSEMKCYQNRGIHGMVKLANGTDIYLIEDAHFSENGVYSALGEDEEGNDWEVEWEVLPDYNADGDEGGACDWEHPDYAHNSNNSFQD
jgi:hypothetical protein